MVQIIHRNKFVTFSVLRELLGEDCIDCHLNIVPLSIGYIICIIITCCYIFDLSSTQGIYFQFTGKSDPERKLWKALTIA